LAPARNYVGGIRAARQAGRAEKPLVGQGRRTERARVKTNVGARVSVGVKRLHLHNRCHARAVNSCLIYRIAAQAGVEYSGSFVAVKNSAPNGQIIHEHINSRTTGVIGVMACAILADIYAEAQAGGIDNAANFAAIRSQTGGIH